MVKSIIFAALVPFSLVGTVFGPLGSDIIATMGMTVADLGRMISISQSGVFVAFFLQPLLFRYLKALGVLKFSLAAYAVALACIAYSSDRTMLTASYTFLSFSSYLFSNATFVVLNTTYPEQRSANIPLTHLVYSISSIAAAWSVSWFKGPHWQRVYVYASVAFMLLAIFSVVGKSRREPARTSVSKGTKTLKHLITRQEFVVFCLLMTVYLGSEGSVATFSPMLFDFVLHSSPAQTAAAVMVFWIGMTVSRAAIVPMLKKAKVSPHLFMAALVLACSGSVWLLSSAMTNRSANLAMLATGLCIGPINPLLQLIMAEWYPDWLAFMSNVNLMCSVIGRMTIPVVVTALAERTSMQGGLRVVVLFLLVSIMLLIGAVSLRRRQLRSDGQTC